jgi:hypothetical protein
VDYGGGMKIFLLGSLLFVISGSLGDCAGVNFPSEQPCVSPDSFWKIHCVTEKQGAGYLHKIILTRRGATKENSIWAASRSCDVLWSPSSQALAITDWSGSSTAEIYLVEASESASVVPLPVNAVEKIVSKVELGGHCYYEALKWNSAHNLSIRIFGHTDENPSHDFTYYLSVDTVSGMAKLLRKENEESNLMHEKTEPTKT